MNDSNPLHSQKWGLSSGSSNILFLGQIPRDWDEEIVKSVVCGSGKIIDVRMTGGRRKNKGYCFVEYLTPNEAQKAIPLLSRISLMGGKRICVEVDRGGKKFRPGSELYRQPLSLNRSKLPPYVRLPKEMLLGGDSGDDSIADFDKFRGVRYSDGAGAGDFNPYRRRSSDGGGVDFPRRLKLSRPMVTSHGNITQVFHQNEVDSYSCDEADKENIENISNEELFPHRSESDHQDLFAQKVDSEKSEDLFAHKVDSEGNNDLFANKVDSEKSEDLFAHKVDSEKSENLFRNRSERSSNDENRESSIIPSESSDNGDVINNSTPNVDPQDKTNERFDRFFKGTVPVTPSQIHSFEKRLIRKLRTSMSRYRPSPFDKTKFPTNTLKKYLSEPSNSSLGNICRFLFINFDKLGFKIENEPGYCLKSSIFQFYLLSFSQGQAKYLDQELHYSYFRLLLYATTAYKSNYNHQQDDLNYRVPFGVTVEGFENYIQTHEYKMKKMKQIEEFYNTLQQANQGNVLIQLSHIAPLPPPPPPPPPLSPPPLDEFDQSNKLDHVGQQSWTTVEYQSPEIDKLNEVPDPVDNGETLQDYDGIIEPPKKKKKVVQENTEKTNEPVERIVRVSKNSSPDTIEGSSESISKSPIIPEHSKHSPEEDNERSLEQGLRATLRRTKSTSDEQEALIIQARKEKERKRKEELRQFHKNRDELRRKEFRKTKDSSQIIKRHSITDGNTRHVRTRTPSIEDSSNLHKALSRRASNSELEQREKLKRPLSAQRSITHDVIIDHQSEINGHGVIEDETSERNQDNLQPPKNITPNEMEIDTAISNPLIQIIDEGDPDISLIETTPAIFEQEKSTRKRVATITEISDSESEIEDVSKLNSNVSRVNNLSQLGNITQNENQVISEKPLVHEICQKEKAQEKILSEGVINESSVPSVGNSNESGNNGIEVTHEEIANENVDNVERRDEVIQHQEGSNEQNEEVGLDQENEQAITEEHGPQDEQVAIEDSSVRRNEEIRVDQQQKVSVQQDEQVDKEHATQQNERVDHHQEDPVQQVEDVRIDQNEPIAINEVSQGVQASGVETNQQEIPAVITQNEQNNQQQPVVDFSISTEALRDQDDSLQALLNQFSNLVEKSKQPSEKNTSQSEQQNEVCNGIISSDLTQLTKDSGYQEWERMTQIARSCVGQSQQPSTAPQSQASPKPRVITQTQTSPPHQIMPQNTSHSPVQDQRVASPQNRREFLGNEVNQQARQQVGLTNSVQGGFSDPRAMLLEEYRNKMQAARVEINKRAEFVESRYNEVFEDLKRRKQLDLMIPQQQFEKYIKNLSESYRHKMKEISSGHNSQPNIVQNNQQVRGQSQVNLANYQPNQQFMSNSASPITNQPLLYSQNVDPTIGRIVGYQHQAPQKVSVPNLRAHNVNVSTESRSRYLERYAPNSNNSSSQTSVPIQSPTNRVVVNVSVPRIILELLNISI